jgi:malate dehydrogenase
VETCGKQTRPLKYGSMTTVAILGAGPIGSAIAVRLAERTRVRRIVAIDENAQAAAGKMLDIAQSGPIGRYDTHLSATADALAAAGADAIVIADDLAQGEWEGERGLALVQRLARAGTTAPFVFAGPKQLWLLEAAARELGIAPHRLVGTAASAAVPTLAALVHIELGETGARVGVTGRPPVFVPAWSAATIGAALLTDRVAAHRLLSLSATLGRFWPPGPQAIAAPTALVVEALIMGSRRRHAALAMLDGELGARSVAGLAELELGRGRILSRHLPTLSPQERTEAANAFLRR